MSERAREVIADWLEHEFGAMRNLGDADAILNRFAAAGLATGSGEGEG